MSKDDLRVLGTVLASIGGILERKGVCNVREIADTLGGVALKYEESGYSDRPQQIGSLAHVSLGGVEPPIGGLNETKTVYDLRSAQSSEVPDRDGSIDVLLEPQPAIKADGQAAIA